MGIVGMPIDGLTGGKDVGGLLTNPVEELL